MTESQIQLVREIEERMLELGLPKDFMFNRGDITSFFVDNGSVLITWDGHFSTLLSHNMLTLNEN